jgi:hypothetical protein
MLRQTVSQPIYLNVNHLSVAKDQIFITASCGFVDIGRPLWREDGSVHNCCWSPPAESNPVFIHPGTEWYSYTPQALGSVVVSRNRLFLGGICCRGNVFTSPLPKDSDIRFINIFFNCNVTIHFMKTKRDHLWKCSQVLLQLNFSGSEKRP